MLMKSRVLSNELEKKQCQFVQRKASRLCNEEDSFQTQLQHHKLHVTWEEFINKVSIYEQQLIKVSTLTEKYRKKQLEKCIGFDNHSDRSGQRHWCELKYYEIQLKEQQQFAQFYDNFVLDHCNNIFNLSQSNLCENTLRQILKMLLKRPYKCKQTKRLINLAMRKAQSIKKFCYRLSPAQRATILEQIKTLNRKILQKDDTIALLQTFSEENKKKLEYFIDLVSQFEMEDYGYLYHRQTKLQWFIGKLLTNDWDLIRPAFQPYLERFLDLIKIKIEFISESRLVYAAIYRIQKRLQTALNYKGQRKNINVDDHLTDLLFQHYIQQVQTRSTRNGIYYVRDPKTDQRIPLSEFIASCKEFFDPLSGWTEIFYIVTSQITKRDSNYDIKKSEVMAKFVENQSYIIFPTQNCLGCSQFFYVNHNIYRPEICKHHLVLFGSISQISNYAATIKDQICALLNGKGGVILFDCAKTNNTVIPRGGIIIEKEKTLVEQKLTDYLDGIYPKPQIGKHIFISWVAIAQDPLQIKQTSNRSPIFQEGVYVARIVVKPTHGHVAYFWTQDDKPIFSIRTESLFPQGKKQVSGRYIHKFAKKKLKDFDEEFRDLLPIESKNFKQIVCSMDHVCKKPQVGIQMFNKKEQPIQIIQNPEQKYKYASVVVAKRSDHQTIRKNLQRYNIQCVIVAPFENLKLKGAAHSGIMYHNVRFDQILAVISNNKDFQFGGRNLLVILITEFIRLTQRNQRNIMSQSDFTSLGVWLQKQYPKQTLKMWKFITENNDQEFYIETGSKQSSLYIYIVMTQFLQRSSFKNPKGLERMSDYQRQSRFKLMYKK